MSLFATKTIKADAALELDLKYLGENAVRVTMITPAGGVGATFPFQELVQAVEKMKAEAEDCGI